MAWRIDEAVVRGEIDNRVEGRTIGRIWLVGRQEPMTLELVGDCWRDLAGTRLAFHNPSPVACEDAAEIEIHQKGIIGDMTASKKVRVPLVDDSKVCDLHKTGGEIPYEWKNVLYLEWFGEINGRVVIETTEYKLEVSSHAWTMDEDGEEAQKLANLNAMRDFMAQVIRRREPSGEEDEYSDDMDEFAWEQRLKESDRLTDAYQEVLEKYMEDSDCERKEAFVMGWDGLLEEMAERDEANARDGVDESAIDAGGRIDFDDIGSASDFADDGDPFGKYERHPLQARAQELALRAMDVVSSESSQGSPPYLLISNLLQVSGKLAGALNDRSGGYEPETGYVLAILKRCLNWLNEAVGACQELMTHEEDADQLAALAHIRSSIFEIRDGITELRRELK
ncbi:MAG: hypothetical protein RLZ22_1492 [Verrucomicrobiota bacterium]|jgi:hypothetical protein